MKLEIKKDNVSNILLVFIQDSSSTTGAGLVGLDENSSILGGYVREGGTGIALTVDENVTTEGTYQAPSTAAKVRIGTPTNMRPGFYELHFHDSLFATGAEVLTLGFGGAANMADLPLEIQLVNKLSSTAADNLELQYNTTGLTGDTFPATQAQVGNLTSGSAAISKNTYAVIIATGVEVNTFAETEQLDGTVHEINPSGGNTEFYYSFNVGGNGVPVSITWQGYANSKNDSYAVKAKKWSDTSWKQIGTIEGVNGSTVETETFVLTIDHVGVGANLGEVQFQITSTDGTGFNTDRLFVSYAVVSESVGYSQGSIWINTNANNTNTEVHVDGTADNPVSTWAAALNLSSQLNMKRFQAANGSAIILTGNSDNYVITGQGYTLDLNGQSIIDAYFFGATTTGIGTGGGTVFEDCPIGNVTLEPSVMRRCFYFGTITNSGAGDWFINEPRSRVAGSGSPIFDFGSVIGDTNLNIRGNSGGWQLESMGDTGTDTASIEGWGQVIEGTCIGGVVVIRGNFTTSGITNLTLIDGARYERDTHVRAIWDRVMTMGNHNIQNSAGKILRELKEIAGYEGGFIYYDSEGGSAGNEPFTNGTLENPVNNETDLLTLKATLNMDQVKIKPGSTLTLTASHEKQEYIGEAWTLILGGQSISASFFHGATDVSGICTGVIPPKFEDCMIKIVTMPPSSFHKCGFAGIFTIGSVGDFFFVGDSHSAVAGIGTPSFDYGEAIGVTNLNFRGYHGGQNVKNMKTGDNLSFDGDGQIIIDSSSGPGTMRIAGHQKMTGAAAFEAAGGVISDDARFAIDQLPDPVNVISSLSGSIEVEAVKNGGTIVLYQNTAMASAIDLAKDMTGRKIFFSAVRDLDDAEYSIPDGGTVPKEVTSDFNLVTGEGLLSFTGAELNIDTGTLEAEVHSTPDAGGDSVPEMIFKIKLKNHPSNL